MWICLVFLLASNKYMTCAGVIFPRKKLCDHVWRCRMHKHERKSSSKHIKFFSRDASNTTLPVVRSLLIFSYIASEPFSIELNQMIWIRMLKVIEYLITATASVLDFGCRIPNWALWPGLGLQIRFQDAKSGFEELNLELESKIQIIFGRHQINSLPFYFKMNCGWSKPINK